ncbi:MAG: hypothetical protein COB81_03055 [Flavobacteriaceae bacterium]|nr:MAG: hypothetical protein COB81_03055 [Flavobacteriaceae bacterium]
MFSSNLIDILKFQKIIKAYWIMFKLWYGNVAQQCIKNIGQFFCIKNPFTLTMGLGLMLKNPIKIEFFIFFKQKNNYYHNGYN